MLWQLLIILIAVIIIWILDHSNEKTQKEVDSNGKISEVNSNGKTELQEPIGDFYYTLDPDREKAIAKLRIWGSKAQKIVPSFPDFPSIWLPAPSDKYPYASLGESYTIQFFELLFPGHKFVKDRPDWLRNPETGRKLELDGYCPELSLAIEYNGAQHYKRSFGMSDLEFRRSLARDRVKVEICNAQHICLIRISYLVPLERIPLACYAKLLEAVPGLLGEGYT